MRECLTVSVAHVQHRVLARETGVRYHGWTTTRGFKSNGEVLPLSLYVRKVRLFFLMFF